MIFEFTPIAVFKSKNIKNKLQAPRQSHLSNCHLSNRHLPDSQLNETILQKKQNSTDSYLSGNDSINNNNIPEQKESNNYILINTKLKQGLNDLSGFSHIWVVYVFDKNYSESDSRSNLKTMILPPRSSSKKGVFATRSPYRPNPIGISVLKIKSINLTAGKIFISTENDSEIDLLDNTPILDIKPYIPEYDSVPMANSGWLKDIEKESYQLFFSDLANQQLQFLQENDRTKEKFYTDFKNILIRQLSFDPFNSSKKRVKLFDNQNQVVLYVFSYRYWRVVFSEEKSNQETLSKKNLFIKNIFNQANPDDKRISDSESQLMHKFNLIFK